MIRTQGIGTFAAIGGLAATIVMLAGFPTAKADELADLRANQQLLQQRIDQLAQAQAQALPETKAYPGLPGAMGTAPIPGQALAGGSFPRSFLIPGTDTSIRVGGFVDITALDFLQGGGNVPGSNNSSNSGQNGNLHSMPVGEAFIPGVGVVPQSKAHSKGNGVFVFSPQQSRINVETRTPTAWGESRTFFEFDWSGCNNYSCQALQQGGGNSMLPRLEIRLRHLGRACSPARRCQTSPMPTPTPNRWSSAAPKGRPVVIVSRRCATRSPARTAAPSRCRRNSR